MNKNVLIIFFLFLFLSLSSYSQFKPTDVPGCKMWLRADSNIVKDGNNKIIEWKDCSGNSNNTSQSTQINQPLLLENFLNGNPVVQFDGVNDYLSFSDITISSLSFFCVFKKQNGNIGGLIGSNSGTYNGIVNYYDGNTYLDGGNYASAATGQIINYSVLNIIYSNPGSEFFVNGVSKGGASAALNLSINLLGVRNPTSNEFLSGEIAELILYDNSISGANRLLVESYLEQKYSKKIRLGADTTINQPLILDAGTGFTNYLWRDGSFNQTLTVSQTGKYWVQANDNLFNYLAKDTISVTFINTKLNHQNDTAVCFGSGFFLKPIIENKKKYSFLWSDNSTDSLININTTGSYWVKITDSLGHYAYSDTINVFVDDLSQKVNLGNDTSFCSGNYIRIQPPLLNPQNLTYTWSDGSHDTTLTVMITGKYKVTVTSFYGCSGKDSVNVTITGTAPNTLFKADTVCFGSPTQFTDLSDAFPFNIVKWHWQFTASDTSNLQNPSYIFDSAGVHSVLLVTYTNGGCSKPYYKNVLVQSVPTPAFSVGVACKNTPYQFVDLSSVVAGDTIASWDWNFGDASPNSNQQNPFHVYTHGNDYNITLTIQTKHGCQNSVSHVLHVDSISASPSAPILISPSNNAIITDTNVTFSWQPSQNAFRYKIIIASDSNFNNIITNTYTDSTHFHKIFNTTSQIFYWRVISNNICSDYAISQTKQFRIFSPREFVGLKLWLKADAGVTETGNMVSLWKDFSGNSNNAFQSNMSNRPLYLPTQLNGLPVLRFDGSSSSLNIPYISTSKLSFFCVFKKQLGNIGVLIGSNNGSTDCIINHMENNSYVVDGTSSWVLAPTGELTNYGILSIVYDHSNSEFFVNSVSKGGSSNTINPIFNTVGSRTNGSLFLSGDIAEIILFDSVLVDTNRQKIENYLFLKYAWPKVDLGPDINDSYSLCPVILDAGNRFSNFLWSTGDTTQTITTQSSGTFSVTVTNGFGFQSSDTVNVSLKTFNMADTAFCLGSYVTLSSKLNHKYRFLWSDLSTDSILTTNVAGKYWLRVSDSLGLCSVADTFNVVADSFAVKVSLGPNRNICSGEYLGLVSGASEAIIYFWSNGSGNSIIVVPDPVGSQPTYSVIVTDINSCIGMDTITLNVTGVKPIVNFSFDSVCFGSPTHFTDASSVASGDVINGRKWMFYDNDSSTLTNPSHIFSHDGVFNVSLNVTTVLGCNTSLIKPITVFSIPTPEFSPGMGCHLAPTKFFDASHSAYGNIEEWHWEFDDPASGGNDTSFQQNPIHNFDLPGTYNVLQRVRTIVGCTDSIRKTVVIKSTPNADYLATTTCVGKETYFADQTFVLPQDEIMEWHWKFGDGDSSATKNPAHLYTSAGSFTAVMKIKSLNGCWAAMTKNVKIHAMPDAAFATLGSCLTFGTQFTDNTTILDDTITQWRWGFGNGDASNLQNPLYIYPDTGAYNVTLNVITNAGCADSVRQTIQVHSLPKAEFTFNPEYGDSPLDVDFYNQSIRGTSYLWDFGDGTAPSLDQNPTHVYTADGIYKILLTTYNQFNCPDTTSYYVYVIPSYSDIMVKSVTAEIKDNKLTIKAELKNVGSRRLRHLELAAHVSNENSIIENWDGILSPGQTMTYEFSAKFYVSSQQTIDFVCVLANVLDDNTEFNKSDNEACAVLTEEFSVQNPYPNPTKDQINITYIVPFEDNVEIKLYDSKGELVYTIFSGTAVQGFNRIVLDVSLLAQGVYAYKVVFRDKVQANRFVKN